MDNQKVLIEMSGLSLAAHDKGIVKEFPQLIRIFYNTLHNALSDYQEYQHQIKAVIPWAIESGIIVSIKTEVL